MNFLKKIFGGKTKIKIDRDLEEVLKSEQLEDEEILRFKIVRLEVLLKKAKENLKVFLKPKKK